MKNAMCLLLLLPYYSLAQWVGFNINFDSNNNLNHLYIDTVSNPNNIWQIGVPDKPYFYNPTSLKAIVTDTLTPYPPNDTSSFIIWAVFEPQTIHDFSFLSAFYKVNSDTLNDYGKIEFSADLGSTWVLISDDTLQYIQGTDTVSWPKIVDYSNGDLDDIQLTGTSSNGFSIYFYITDFWGTDFFNFQVDDFENFFNLSYGDTMMFKFTFISDNNPESMDGLLFDNIQFMQEYPTGINENKFETFNIYPNPASTEIQIQNLNAEIASIKIYSMDGRQVYLQNNPNQNKIPIEFLENGTYQILLETTDGKFLTNRFIKL